jgi:serine/arginine repetitive matrix protein 1
MPRAWSLVFSESQLQTQFVMADAGELRSMYTTVFLCFAHRIISCLSKGFFKGTSADQDRRFSDKELKLLKSMKFPANFEQKVLISVLH